MAPSILDRDRDEHWRWDWPPKINSVNQHDVSPDQYHRLRELLDRRVGEREIEGFLSENLEVLSLIMTSTGHHQSWVFSKEAIRPPSERIGGGLIPDYLLAGAGSFGVDWFVLELKGPDKRAFAKTGHSVSLSNHANKGICQLLNYIDVSARDQAYFRDTLRLLSFREPRGILLIGTDAETEDDPFIRDFKNAWNRVNSKVKIRSYNALLREVEGKLRDFRRI